mgnify:FL=1
MTNRQLILEDIDKVENLTFVPLEKDYLKVQFVSTVLAWLGLMLLPLFLLFWEEAGVRNIVLISVEAILAAAAAVNLLILPKAFAHKGFAVREHDITYRSGIVFPSVTTVPFCKIQQVSLRQNPVSRLFGLYAVDIVNGAQMQAETVIPGLTREKAEEMKSLLIERANNEGR